MKILHIIASLQGGGKEKALVTYLKNSSPEVKNYVCCITQGGAYEEELNKLNIEYYILKRRFRFDLSVIGQIKQLIKKLNVDIVQTYNFTGNFWGRLGAKNFDNVKKIIFERGTIWGTNFLMNSAEKFLARYTDQILTNSNAAK